MKMNQIFKIENMKFLTQESNIRYLIHIINVDNKNNYDHTLFMKSLELLLESFRNNNFKSLIESYFEINWQKIIKKLINNYEKDSYELIYLFCLCLPNDEHFKTIKFNIFKLMLEELKNLKYSLLFLMNEEQHTRCIESICYFLRGTLTIIRYKILKIIFFKLKFKFY